MTAWYEDKSQLLGERSFDMSPTPILVGTGGAEALGVGAFDGLPPPGTIDYDPCENPDLTYDEKLAAGCFGLQGEVDPCVSLVLSFREKLGLGCFPLEEVVLADDCDRWPVPEIFQVALDLEAYGETVCDWATVERLTQCGDPPCLPTSPYEEPAGAHGAIAESATDIRSASDDEEDLILEAVTMLQDNWPAIEWYCCLYFGPNARICNCLSDWIWGTTPDFFLGFQVGFKDLKIKVKKTGECNAPEDQGDPWGHADNGGRDITICQSAIDQAALLEGAGGRACAVMFIAVVITHEVLHLCDENERFHHPDEDDADVNQCNDKIYAFQRGLVEGLTERYGLGASCPAGLG